MRIKAQLSGVSIALRPTLVLGEAPMVMLQRLEVGAKYERNRIEGVERRA
jgi:hypothetical protein